MPQQGENRYRATVVFDCPTYWNDERVKEYLGKFCTAAERESIEVVSCRGERTDAMPKFFNEGVAAFGDGKNLCACPYTPIDSSAAQQWIAGWTLGRDIYDAAVTAMRNLEISGMSEFPGIPEGIIGRVTSRHGNI